ncbi:MAG: DUF1638 domain-containing protein [Acidimicrobiia bacterium]|nr:DUF1638 domain-containing protein [Acidimicrobiia bacterium]NNL27496.1 DUF1638 domain-containing protein [Acidimicrobiia bacterium]
MAPPDAPQILILGCGALARELLDITHRNGLDHMTVECLPAALHNTPKDITPAVKKRLDRAKGRYDKIFIAYGDCGTGGHLDALIEEYGVQRLPGAHCYEFFAGSDLFAQMSEDQLGTLWLTDYLTRHFDRFMWSGLGMDKHPELIDMYFGNYTRVAYISQNPTPDLLARSAEIATRLGLVYEHIHVGYGEAEPRLIALGATT